MEGKILRLIEEEEALPVDSDEVNFDEESPDTQEQTDGTYTIEEFMAEGKAADEGITEEDVDPEQLAMGIEVEKEHSNNPETCKKIALDHLAEFPEYYSALKEMEDKLKGTQSKQD